MLCTFLLSADKLFLLLLLLLCFSVQIDGLLIKWRKAVKLYFSVACHAVQALLAK